MSQFSLDILQRQSFPFVQAEDPDSEEARDVSKRGREMKKVSYGD